MNRRAALAGLAAGAVCTFLAGRPAAAQSGSATTMSKWAYSTEGFDRIVHRVAGIRVAGEQPPFEELLGVTH